MRDAALAVAAAHAAGVLHRDLKPANVLLDADGRPIVGEEAVAPTALNAATPRDLETIAFRCLHKDPAKRYDSAQAPADD